MLKGALPLVAVTVDEASAAGDTGVVEQQVDVVRVVRRLDGIAKFKDLVLDGHVAPMGAYHAPLGGFAFAQPPGFREIVLEDVTGGDAATLGDQLPGECSPHARSAAGDDRDLPCELVHRGSLPLCCRVAPEV